MNFRSENDCPEDSPDCKRRKVVLPDLCLKNGENVECEENTEENTKENIEENIGENTREKSNEKPTTSAISCYFEMPRTTHLETTGRMTMSEVKSKCDGAIERQYF